MDDFCVVCYEKSAIDPVFLCNHNTCSACFCQLAKRICPYCRSKPRDFFHFRLIKKYGEFRAMSEFINQETVSKIVLLVVVKKYGTCIRYLLKQDEDIALAAVTNNGLSILHVFEHFQTKNVCVAAINQQSEAFAFISKQKQTKFICEFALARNGLMLEFVVKQDTSLCLIAVKQNGMALEHVQIQTKEICKHAIIQNSNAFKFVKSDIGIPDYYEICLLAVKMDGLLLKYVKTWFKTKSLCLIAVHQNSDAINFII